MDVKSNLQHIHDRITEACKKADRTAKDVSVIAVTKYVSPERAREALDAGIKHLGENRDTGLLHKLEILKDRQPVWHFIGTLQTRKVKTIIDHVSYIHSLDRLSLADEIQKRAKKPVSCFVQVNTSLETSKHGMTKEEVLPFVKALTAHENIRIIGLMTMAPFTADETELRNCFRLLKELRDDVQQLEQWNAPCRELSMGMSNDFTIAVEEGATFIRIGSSLVGNEIGGGQR
ncbi:YggS family pyridoxal phosphate-dependent enzyme [Bacillus sp. CLL-7-23]|uniref:Pyridoxal phosphate homeostasis protein n=1 Tax=Bacillus changyiensis TaxID=3004103 RepID=A0ABT4X0X6_9BACI|nr:YggS family pyridoxal phosphate-dependent enzyme [Bacillus changyiensis]MDA7025951.1 YggS family pyridoxal phosphate-dependent enzyme [Bacillus changyiensis]